MSDNLNLGMDSKDVPRNSLNFKKRLTDEVFFKPKGLKSQINTILYGGE